MAILPCHSLTITAMQPQHVVWVAALEARISPFPWSRAQFHEELVLGSCALVVITPEDTVVGFAVARRFVSEWQLLTLGLDPAYQRLGWGRRLLEKIIRMAQDHGDGSLLLEVREDNWAARGLYQAMGFQGIGRRPGYYETPSNRADALVMVLSLDNPS